MFSLFALVVCLAVIGLSLLVHAAYAAPEGEENERGFHLTSPEESMDQPMPHSPLVTAADLVFFRQ